MGCVNFLCHPAKTFSLSANRVAGGSTNLSLLPPCGLSRAEPLLSHLKNAMHAPQAPASCNREAYGLVREGSGWDQIKLGIRKKRNLLPLENVYLTYKVCWNPEQK